MSTEKTDKEKALRRVKKMMALANDSAASEGERDNALRMAHATLAKHNLSMAEAMKADDGREIPGEARSHNKWSAQVRDQPWACSVAAAVGRMCFCDCYFVRLGKGKVAMFFVGTDTNARTASELASSVFKSIMSEANAKWKLQPDPGPWWTNFCKGAAARVSQRCDELRKYGQPGNGTALVLANHYEQEMYRNRLVMLENLKNLRTKSPTRQKKIGNGYGEGFTFGGTVALNKQVK